VALPADTRVRTTQSLTSRETQVVARIAAGAPLKAVAADLGVAHATVTAHVEKALTKLGLRHRAELSELFSAWAPYWKDDAPAPRGTAPTYLFVARERGGGPRHPALERLTPAEREVVTGALDGRSTMEIARARDRSFHTVAHQLRAAFRKLGVHSRAELAALVMGDSANEPL